ncbi:pirin family protein [Clostridium estertheticum]|uniref:pirin family protein n=1 Tax=Clostridium estertheticum TaxID=238834 RepID=UPI001CF17B63|nr:pirin family protein [Clostridium estertheticum]MCB2305445.1 pirin family protein [Clostridium estertheticum]MCB2343884.1 pirin family protein [Clostridium estertheticum]MCB2348801.1 pirin family protein [Clostridium estertheticum]WAG46121.1 pirin family protein [Clostridium estertheticum]
MKTREIRKVVTGTTQYDGAGVKLVRVISLPDVKEFDPFLMLDAFDSIDPDDYTKGFPWHPHRGIETVTYLISGDIEHTDSLGNNGSILDGCCQWMTAGGGILHQEMPKTSNRMLGVQLWLNLPQKDKMTSPKYRDIRADMVTKIDEDDNIIRVISGNYKGNSGAVQGEHVKMLFLDVEMKAGARWELETMIDTTLFVYIVEGEGCFDDSNDKLVPSRSAVLFNDGEKLIARATGIGLRFLLFSGAKLNESIAWGGPIVMNTKEELRRAFKDIEDGTFVK